MFFYAGIAPSWVRRGFRKACFPSPNAKIKEILAGFLSEAGSESEKRKAEGLIANVVTRE